MEEKIGWAIAFVMTAAMAAAVLGYVEHYDLGLSRYTIRTDSLLAACGASGLLIIALYSDKLGKRK
jgi:hypothetical protein